MTYNAVGAYIFAGGFTLGIQKNFEVTTHLEDNPGYGWPTAKHNLGVDVFKGPEEWQIAVDRGLLGSEDDPLDLLYVNPP